MVLKLMEKKSTKKYIMYVLIILFFVGFLSTVFNLNETIIKIATLSFAFILVPIVISIFVGVFLNMRRIKRIMKKLNISDTDEYNNLASLYL